MIKFILPFVFVFVSFSAFSQDDAIYTPLYGSLEGEQYVYADTAFVRSAPGLKASVNDTLFAGDDVKILSNEKVFSTLKGFPAPWSKISYTKQGQQKEGYIWAGLLTLNAMRRSETKFVYGVERVITRGDKDVPDVKYEDYLIGLKAVVNKQKMATYTFKLDSRESNVFTTSQVSGGKGLIHIKNIIALSFSGEACAVPTLTYRFGWTGEKLCLLPVETDIADADVYFYDEELIFPSDKDGKPDTIILKIENSEATEKLDKKGEPIYKTSHEKKLYKWNGSQIRPA